MQNGTKTMYAILTIKCGIKDVYVEKDNARTAKIKLLMIAAAMAEKSTMFSLLARLDGMPFFLFLTAPIIEITTAVKTYKKHKIIINKLILIIATLPVVIGSKSKYPIDARVTFPSITS